MTQPKPTVCYRYNEGLHTYGFLFLRFGQYFGYPAPGFFKKDGCWWHERSAKYDGKGGSVAWMEEISEEQYDEAVVRHSEAVERQCQERQAPDSFQGFSPCPLGSVLGGLF